MDLFGKEENRLDLLIVRRGTGIFIRSAEDRAWTMPSMGDLVISMRAPESRDEGADVKEEAELRAGA